MSKTNTQSNAKTADFAPHDVFSHVQHFGTQWNGYARQQLEQWTGAAEQMGTQLAQWQREGITRANTAADEMTKLVKQSIAYSGELAEQWRTAGIDAARKTLDLVTPRA